MKNIILFTLFVLGFSGFIHAQVVEKYIDSNDSSTTVIEKVPESNDQDILSTLNLDDYSLNEEIYIIDYRQLEKENEEAARERAKKETIVVVEETEEIVVAVEQIEQKTVRSNNTATQVKSVSPERNPIGEKVKRKRKRTPRWKNDRRGKSSRLACFKF